MKAADAKYAAELADALPSIIAVRKGLRARNKVGGTIGLNISAAEEKEGDFLSGYDHAGVTIKLCAAPQIVCAIEKFIRTELRRLKVRR